MIMLMLMILINLIDTYPVFSLGGLARYSVHSTATVL